MKTNFEKITFRLLFPVTFFEPSTGPESPKDKVRLHVVLSFFKTFNNAELANTDWKSGMFFNPCMPGITQRAEVSKVAPYDNKEIVVILTASQHAISIPAAFKSIENKAVQNEICKRIHLGLRPILNCIQAVENEWTISGNHGLFEITDDPNIMHPLRQELVPIDWPLCTS